MSAEQAAADDTSRAPDCVVELSMDRVCWGVDRLASDQHCKLRSHRSAPSSAPSLQQFAAENLGWSTAPWLSVPGCSDQNFPHFASPTP